MKEIMHRLRLLRCFLFGHDYTGYEKITQEYRPNKHFCANIVVEFTRQCDRCKLWSLDWSGYKRLEALKKEIPQESEQPNE